jgi:serine/threonine protein kinase
MTTELQPQIIIDTNNLTSIGSGGEGNTYIFGEDGAGSRVIIKIFHDQSKENEPDKREYLNSVFFKYERLEELNDDRWVKPLGENPMLISDEEGKERYSILYPMIEGQTLAEMRGDLETGQALEYAVSLGEALSAARGLERPVHHRDIKAENIIINDEGQVRIIDLNGIDDPKVRVGTHEYLPIEDQIKSQRHDLGVTQIHDSDDLSGTGVKNELLTKLKGYETDANFSDNWGYAALAYEMLTGKELFGRDENGHPDFDNVHMLLSKGDEEGYNDWLERKISMVESDSLQELFRKAFAIDREERPNLEDMVGAFRRELNLTEAKKNWLRYSMSFRETIYGIAARVLS